MGSRAGGGGRCEATTAGAALVGRLAAGEWATVAMTELRGAANDKAKRELDWQLRYPSWRQGFAKGLRADMTELLDELRPRAFAIAYRMLGSVAEAEDVVQEALLRLHGVLDAGEEIEVPEAYLATIVTRLGINRLRSAQMRRETYFGEWLPEPVVTGGLEDPAVARGDVGLALACLPGPVGAPDARAEGGVPATGGVRLRL